jgi:hypothetical protein
LRKIDGPDSKKQGEDAGFSRFRERAAANAAIPWRSPVKFTSEEKSVMPLPTDEKLLKLSHDVQQQFDTIFGPHPGFRPAHAKGAMLTGRFTPSSDAASLSRAPHLNQEFTPVNVARDSSPASPAKQASPTNSFSVPRSSIRPVSSCDEAPYRAVRPDVRSPH